MMSKFMTAQQKLFAVSQEDWRPHAYQKKAVKFLLEHACSALFLDPGLGKSSITLAALSILFKKKLASKVLVIAPLRVCYNVWPAEVEKWTDFSHLKVVVLHGDNKDELLKSDADIFVINPEGLDWLLKPEKVKSKTGKTTPAVDVRRFKKFGFDTLVIDELTKFKNYSSIRFKMLTQVHTTFGRRFGLTGSPAANGLLDLFGQCYILDEGRSLGQYITHFRNKYFDTPNKFVYTLKHGAADEIYKAVEPLALRMAAEDYLEMPELIVNNIYVDMPDKAWKVYFDLEDDLFTAIDDKAIVASNSGVALGKLRQVVGGAIFEDKEVTEEGFKINTGKRKFIELHDAKLDALEDLVEELQGEPILIAYEFHHERDRLRKRFPKAVFAADYSAKDFKKIEDAWNAGEIPMLCGNAVSISHGLNMQKSGKHVAWYTTTFDYEVYDQFIRRLRRQGSVNKRIWVHHLLVKGTVDMMVYGLIKAKAKGQKALFEAILQLAAERRKKSRKTRA